MVNTLFDLEEFFQCSCHQILPRCSTIHLNIFSSPKSWICPHLMQIFQPVSDLQMYMSSTQKFILEPFECHTLLFGVLGIYDTSLRGH